MGLTFKQVERALPFDLFEKIVRMKLENERKTNPAQDILNRYRIEFRENGNPHIDLSPRDSIDIKEHLSSDKVSFKSFRNIIELLRVMKARARIVRESWQYNVYGDKDMIPCKKLVSIVFDEYR
jgi:thymidylate synthase